MHARNFDVYWVLALHDVGFFYHVAQLQSDGVYRTIHNPKIVQIDPNSGLAEASLFNWPLFLSSGFIVLHLFV